MLHRRPFLGAVAEKKNRKISDMDHDNVYRIINFCFAIYKLIEATKSFISSIYDISLQNTVVQQSTKNVLALFSVAFRTLFLHNITFEHNFIR